jgi:four helix bundle protein
MGNGETKTAGKGVGNGKGNGTHRWEMVMVAGSLVFSCGMTKPKIRDFRDLLAWQRAMDLAVMCESICETLPESARHAAQQIRHAANSVHANIAEGNGRFSRADYLRHLAIANGSLRELESHLHFLKRRFPNRVDIDKALDLATLSAKLLAGLTRSLRPKE